MTNPAPIRGYTLVELIVSIAIFSVVMLIASAAFLTLIQLDRQARATNDVVTNLSYVTDSMARAIRTGTDYRCGSTGGATSDCSPTPNDRLTFTDSEGRRVTYARAGSAVRQCMEGTCLPLTDPRVKVDTLAFYVTGTDTLEDGDTRQPRVIFMLEGSLRPSPESEPVEFTIESGATQRLIDL